jgi:hypothetical protein
MQGVIPGRGVNRNLSKKFLSGQLWVTDPISGVTYSRLNPVLVDAQGLDREAVENLKNTHVLIFRLYAYMESLDPNDRNERAILRELCVPKLELLEYCLQNWWGFPITPSRHNKWLEAPHCICKRSPEPRPHRRKKGFPFEVSKFMSTKCPLHGEVTS